MSIHYAIKRELGKQCYQSTTLIAFYYFITAVACT